MTSPVPPASVATMGRPAEDASSRTFGEPLAVGGLHEQIEGVVERRQVGRGPEEDHPIIQPQVSDLVLDLRSQLAVAHEDQAQARMDRQQPRERPDQQVLSLHLAEVAHAPDEELILLHAKGRSVTPSIGRGVIGRGPDPSTHDVDLAGRHSLVPWRRPP